MYCYVFMYGDDGDDTLVGSEARDYLTGGPGDDDLTAGDTALNCTPGPARAFSITSRATRVTIGWPADPDRIRSTQARVPTRSTGGPGRDAVNYCCTSNPVRVDLDDVADDGEAEEHDNVHGDIEEAIGGLGPDTLVGNSERNILSGLLGNDIIRGHGGDDVLYGGFLYKGRDQDRLYGGPGNDTLKGYDGSDFLDGRGGEDRVFAGPGNDVIQSRDGERDFLHGGADYDRARIDQGLDDVQGLELFLH
jgi:Ca2+-binding RTX toxin-like protein